MGEGLRGVGVVRAVGAGFSALADLALPGECAGCGAGRPSRTGVCAGCATVLDRRPVPVRPARGRAGLPVVYALGGYREPLSDLIIAQKERGRLDLARPLGLALAEVVSAALAAVAVGPGALDGPGRPGGSGALGGSADRVFLPGPSGAAGPGGRDGARVGSDLRDVSDPGRGPGRRTRPEGSAGRPIFLVPIPSAKAAERRRGQDPVLRMARVAAAGLRRDGVRAEVLRALRHGRAVADQVGLSAAGRAANLAGAMRVTAAGHRALSAGPCVVVLLDDVCTSGATLGEGARAVGSAAGFGGPGGRMVAAVLAGPVR